MNTWNTKNLDELFDMGGKKLVSELIDLFIEEATITVRKLIEAIKDNNQEVVGQIAHKMKSSSGSLGLEELAAQCFKLDSKRREGAEILSSDVEELIQKIELSKILLLDYKKQKTKRAS